MIIYWQGLKSQPVECLTSGYLPREYQADGAVSRNLHQNLEHYPYVLPEVYHLEAFNFSYMFETMLQITPDLAFQFLPI